MLKLSCILILCLCLMFSAADPVSSTDSTTDSSSSSTTNSETTTTTTTTTAETTTPTKLTTAATSISTTTSSTKPKTSSTTTTPPDSNKYPWLYPTTASPNEGSSMNGIGIFVFVISGMMVFMFVVWVIMSINNGCCMQTQHTSGVSIV
jgi:cytoskeletal protein RodZ